ncbi:pentatricopeptide repeat-containing protein [Panicum miliaceum]|uniref:Pentatricopeptide repeat-containing protein n=1 Tax=Panicum miliaceum TaxID=4540 RepID=A0A3L6T930_PANMI|nr:pentatricopeptide repeat-containing protein [Panicum miliaceum]
MDIYCCCAMGFPEPASSPARTACSPALTHAAGTAPLLGSHRPHAPPAAGAAGAAARAGGVLRPRGPPSPARILDATAAAALPRARDAQITHAHHPFAETPRRPTASATTPLAALRGRLLAGLPVSPTAFSAAVARSDPDTLPALHGLAVASGLDAFAAVTNSLVARYAKAGGAGSFPAVARVLATARERDTSSYNTILTAIPDPEDALTFAARMLRSGDMRPDAVTFTFALSVSAGRGELGFVRQLHALASRAGQAADVFVCNALVTAYSRGGSLDAARKVFYEMPARDLVSWNAMVCGLAQEGDCPDEVIRVFLRMLKDGDARPDRISVCSVIPVCGGGKTRVKLGVEGHVSIGNVLVAMYYKCGTPDCARKLFKFMDERDVISWTTAAAANSLITMYAKLQRMDDAKMVFNLMPHPEIIAWNALISGYAQNEKCEDALEVFSSMVKSMKPNETTFASVLSAVTSVETVPMAYGQMYHCQTQKLRLGTNEYVSGALIDLYAKRGSLEESWKAFGETVHRSLIAWTAIISAHSKHGNYYAKEVGFSWVDAGAVSDSLHLHKFSSDDMSHPRTEEIYRVAEWLGWEMKILKNPLQVEMEYLV